jgi:hypothetical protein
MSFTFCGVSALNRKKNKKNCFRSRNWLELWYKFVASSFSDRYICHTNVERQTRNSFSHENNFCLSFFGGGGGGKKFFSGDSRIMWKKVNLLKFNFWICVTQKGFIFLFFSFPPVSRDSFTCAQMSRRYQGYNLRFSIRNEKVLRLKVEKLLMVFI